MGRILEKESSDVRTTVFRNPFVLISEDIDVYDSSCYIHKSTEEAISLHNGEEFIPTTEFLYEINL